MSVRSVGIDLLEVERMERALERWGTRLLDRVFTDIERRESERGVRAEALAARYAAKEAVSKCLGTGFTQGVHRKDIEVVSDERGAPGIVLHGGAAEMAAGARFHLSLTHTDGMAAAVAVMLEPLERER
jgi:holo-[acyl-carrier protein] synthase